MNLTDPSQLAPNPCYFELVDWLVLQCQGEDAANFLQGQITADLTKVNLKQASLSAVLNLKGRAISSFILINIEKNTFWILLPKDSYTATLESFKKYSVFSKVEFSVIESHRLLGIAGIKTETVADALKISAAQMPTQQYQVEQINACILVKLAGKERYLLSIPSEQVASTTSSLDSVTGAPIKTDEFTWLTHQILAKEVFIGAALTETVIPSILNYEHLGAISHEKGCYRGQEIIARLHFRGTSKEALFLGQVTHSNSTTHAIALDKLVGAPIYRPNNEKEQKLGTLLLASTLNPSQLIFLALFNKSQAQKATEENWDIEICNEHLQQLQFFDLHYT